MDKKEKILSKFKNVDSIVDLVGYDEPSKLFYILANRLYYLLDDDAEKLFSDKSLEIRNYINKIIRLLGPIMLNNRQIFESKNELIGKKVYDSNSPDLSDEAVIWASNHHFKEDALGTVLAAKRNAYILFGSLPQFYNTFDGITAWLNGVILVNRKNKNSKKSAINKCIYLVKKKKDLIIYPEGVWNKSPNQLMLNLWPGIYRICKETGCKVIPVSHYIRDCSSSSKDNFIHTVVDNPIRIDDLSEEAGLRYLRDIIATWYYLMMEKYGKSTREEELGSCESSVIAWEEKLKLRISTAERYDPEIELCADFVRKQELEYLKVLRDIANIQDVTVENVHDVTYARKLLNEYNLNNFQRRF